MDERRAVPRSALVALVAIGLAGACGAVPGPAAPAGPAPTAGPAAPAWSPAAGPSSATWAPSRTPAPTRGAAPSSAEAKAPTNVVLLIGDGLGIGAREATRLVHGELAMDELRFAGWVRTSPADPDAAVTDSAAAATALATGVRTRNGSVGVDRRGRARDSLLDLARRSGRSTGLVTTAEVTDATPAAFGAHVADRDRHARIARQYVRGSRPDVVLGGGADRWSKKLRAAARAQGWKLVTTASGLERTRSPKILGLFADRRMFDRGVAYAPSPTLRTMTAKALEVLSADKDGFFLVVEEEAIDEMAHVNAARLAIKATRAFDRTVALVHRFAEKNPRTLVVVVGDHETGGLSVERSARSPGPDADGPFRIEGSRLDFYVDWTTRSHTGSPTPLSAEGPGAQRLARAQHLTRVHDVLAEVLEEG